MATAVRKNHLSPLFVLLMVGVCCVRCDSGLAFDSHDVSLTCGRNQHLDISTEACHPCPPCYFLDQEEHTDQSCLPCSQFTNHSSLAYCPARCMSKPGGLADWARVIVSALVMIIVPFIVIPLSLIVMSLFVH